MAIAYASETIDQLRESFGQCRLHRPMRPTRYEPGTELTYDVTGVAPARRGRVTLRVEKFVGGGFAGQVYRVTLLAIDAPDGPVAGLEVGKEYAVKILVPPSAFSETFRNAVYAVGFQAPFQLQCNPSAARAGALWQKFIRRAAALRFGTERAVVDIHATFIDPTIGSCGEISEWIAGRQWRFEVDAHLDARRRWLGGQDVPPEQVGSAEYLAKRKFMRDFVSLLHEIGAPEFARQYEWWTAKSQPNVMKRVDSDADPHAGLTAVDFRAGLALLPFLPMSPGDVGLIVRGVAHGRIVQFDRGSLDKLQRFVDANAEHFADLGDAFAELREAERVYRDSQPDVTHNHARLLYDGRLWGTMLDSAVTGWRVRNVLDDAACEKLRACPGRTVLFALAGCAAKLGVLAGVVLAVLTLLGTLGAAGWAWAGGSAVAGLACGFARKLWGRADLQSHYASVLTSLDYLVRTLRGRRAEAMVQWVRRGRIREDKAVAMVDRPIAFLGHLALSPLPAVLHRMLTDRAVAMEKLWYVFVRPAKLYFNAPLREQWLRDMVRDGLRKGMLTDEEAQTILQRMQEPFIQKYLKALAVHVCTLPVTQVVSVAIAIWYVVAHPELSRAEAWAAAGIILAAFQLTPISPGSFCRGAYVVYLVIRERNFRDYNIAVFMGFFKYIGYLSFPIQMAYRYPALARFMAGHWATEFVHVVPIFGEHGALLEHGVFDLFYNRPLTIRRHMQLRAERRRGAAARRWHAVVAAAVVAAAFGAADWFCLRTWGAVPTLKNLWWMTILVPMLAGGVVALGAGGLPLGRRVALAGGCAILAAAGATALLAWVNAYAPNGGIAPEGNLAAELVVRFLWRTFLFAVFAVIGAFLVETRTTGAVDCPPVPGPNVTGPA